MTEPEMGRRADFYREWRVEAQQRFYDARRLEYRAAARQLYGITTGLLVLAAVAGVLAVSEVLIDRQWWGLMASACSALAAISAAWATLMGFEENERLYSSTRVMLDPVRGILDDNRTDAALVAEAVTRAEALFEGEAARWGQRTSPSAATFPHPAHNGPPADGGGDQ